MEDLRKNDPRKELKRSPNLVFLLLKSKVKSQIEEFQTCFNLAERKCYTESTWQLQKYKCWPTAKGWIFMISPYYRCSFFDFFNKKSIKLPSINHKGSLENDRCGCVLTKRNGNYVIMFVNYTRQCIYFYDDDISKEKKWLSYNYGDEGKEKDIWMVGSCNGQFYGTSFTNFLKIDYIPKPKITTMEPLYTDNRLGSSCTVTYMLEAREDLYIVCKHLSGSTSKNVCAFVVWKRDNSSQTWNKVDDIGDQVFFLGPSLTAAAWPATEIESKGNLIYFVERRNKRLYCYDMEEATITVDIPCPSLKSQLCYQTWIFPTLRGQI